MDQQAVTTTGGASQMQERSSAISMQQYSRNIVAMEYECVSEEFERVHQVKTQLGSWEYHNNMKQRQ